MDPDTPEIVRGVQVIQILALGVGNNWDCKYFLNAGMGWFAVAADAVGF